jgi:hypothetical protein
MFTYASQTAPGGLDNLAGPDGPWHVALRNIRTRITAQEEADAAIPGE